MKSANKSKEYKLAIKIAGEVEKSLLNSTKLTKKELTGLAKVASTASKAMHAVTPIFSTIEGAAKKMFDFIKKGAVVAGTAIALAVTSAVSVGAPFEAQMSTVEAISGATARDMGLLSEKAKQMGRDTVFSATEAGKAMEYMSMAGWKTDQMLGGIDGIMNLAAASGEDLGLVSDIVTDALTGFGMAAEESSHFADILAAASSNSNTNVAMMGETFKYVAPIAGALGHSAEDTALAIGLMANSGIKASMAGTSLRKILTETTNGVRLSGKAFAAAGEAQGELFIETVNTDGSMRNLKEVIESLRTGFSQLTESEQAMNAENIAGKMAMSGLLAIVNDSEENYDKLANSIENCEDAAYNMSQIRLDNFLGDVAILKSGMESLGIEVFDGFVDVLRSGTQMSTGFINSLTTWVKKSDVIPKFMDKIKKSVPTAIRQLKEFKNSFLEFASPVLSLGGWLIQHPDVIVSTLVGIGTALTAFKVAKGIMAAAKAFAVLSSILTVPFAGVILAAGLAIGGAAGIAMYVTKANEKLKKQNLAKHFGEISLSIEDLKRTAEHIIQTGSLEKLWEVLEVMEGLDSIKYTISGVVKELNTANWKVSIGMELSETERRDYRSNIESFISESQKLVEQNQYALTLSVQALMGDGAESQEMQESFNTFYDQNRNTLAELGTRLQETVNTSFEDGFLSIDEVKAISEIQTQMASITQKLAQSKFDAKMEILDLKYGGGELDSETFLNLQLELAEQVKAATDGLESSLELTIADVSVQLDSGAINQAERDNMVGALKAGFLEQTGTIELKATNFQTETIMKQYETELEAAIPGFKEKYESALNKAMNNPTLINNPVGVFTSLINDVKDSSGLDKSTKAAIGELYKQIEPTAQQMEDTKAKSKEWGGKMPEGFQEGLNNISLLGAISGSTDAMWGMVGESAINSTEYMKALGNMEEHGGAIPITIAEAVIGKREELALAADTVYTQLNSALKNRFQNGMDINIPLNINTAMGPPKLQNSPIKAYATGGIITSPTLATFAENGPEAAIPLDGSRNALNLWHQAGRLLGVHDTSKANGDNPKSFSSLYSEMSGSGGEKQNVRSDAEIKISYNPIQNFYGDVPSQEDLNRADEKGREEFRKMMDQYFRERDRKSFA